MGFKTFRVSTKQGLIDFELYCEYKDLIAFNCKNVWAKMISSVTERAKMKILLLLRMSVNELLLINVFQLKFKCSTLVYFVRSPKMKLISMIQNYNSKIVSFPISLSIFKLKFTYFDLISC